METMPPTTIHIVGLELDDAAGIVHIAVNAVEYLKLLPLCGVLLKIKGGRST